VQSSVRTLSAFIPLKHKEQKEKEANGIIIE
jgi:hypothetical protein